MMQKYDMMATVLKKKKNKAYMEKKVWQHLGLHSRVKGDLEKQ